MADTQQSQSQDGSLGRDLLYALRYYLGSRRGLLVLAGLAIAMGLALNWSWLAAAGIAPILISVLPCLAMCALGLCMNRATGGSCKSNQAGNTTATGDETALPDGALNNLLPNETSRDAQTVSVAVSSRHSLSKTKQKRKTTDD